MNDWPLGKNTTYESLYNPKLLTPVSRQLTRTDIGIELPIPFKGMDIWNAWEISWLDIAGKPHVANARIQYSAESTHLIESKSFKLYLNSYNQSNFKSKEVVSALIAKDLSSTLNTEVEVILNSINDPWPNVDKGTGLCLDDLELDISDYELMPSYLDDAVDLNSPMVSEELCSHLFKSNCMVTGQPDWASIFITYTGQLIDHKLLMKYLISFRNHQAFHEPCVERIFVDLMNYCQPDKLSVYCRYTRRGGLDINPFRSTEEIIPSNQRIWRQ